MSLLQIDHDLLAAGFGRRAFTVRHTLTDHPLLTVDAVAALADALPLDQVEHNYGDLPAILADGAAPRAELAPGEIARGIEHNGCWMVLKNIESHSDYCTLLDATLDEVAPHVPRAEGGMGRREGFVFLSAPASVTPVHVDPEHNFLLQVRGTKTMNVGSLGGSLDAQRELERYYSGGHRNLAALPGTAAAFPLGPGDGVYVPLHAPHWVTNGPAVSVSLSITFYTRATDRAARVHVANAALRRLHVTPRPPGASPLADRTKEALTRSWRLLRRVR